MRSWSRLRSAWLAVLLVVGVFMSRAQAPHAVPTGDPLLDSADLWVARGRAQEAFTLVNPAVDRFASAKDTINLRKVLRRVCRASYDMGDLGTCARCSQRLMDLGTRTLAYGDAGYALNYLAIIADQVSPPDTVRHMYERVLHYFQLAGDSVSCAITYDNLGFYPLLEQPRNYAKCIAFSERAKACLKDTTVERYHRTLAIIESSLCNYYSWWGKDAEAIKHGLLSVQHAELSGEMPTLIHVTTELASAYSYHKDHARALQLLLRSDSLAQVSSMPLNKRRDIPEMLSAEYEAMGDYANALKYEKQREDINERLRGDATKREMERLERRRIHEGDSLAQVVALHDQAMLNKEELRTERTKRWIAFGGIAAVMAISVVLWDRYRRSRAANATIMAAQKALLVSESKRGAEEVRTRIARDVHDDLGSDLTKLALLGNEVKRIAGDGKSTLTEAVDRLAGLSRMASASLSDIVWAVDPAQDSCSELVRHAHTYTLRMLDATGIRSDLNFMAKGIDRPIDPATKRDIFLLLKEALNNALKHAHASRIDVELVTDGSGFDLLVRDDGVGYSADGITEGNGTRSMRARATRLGATLERTASPGNGCIIRVHGGSGWST